MKGQDVAIQVCRLSGGWSMSAESWDPSEKEIRDKLVQHAYQLLTLPLETFAKF